MNHRKQPIFSRLSLVFISVGFSMLLTAIPAQAYHAADCSDVFTPLSSFVQTGVNNNKSFYVQAMNETGVPWEMLAAIHYRETNFSHTNPSNGQGIFQFANGDGGPYPPGPVDDTEFYRQLKFMANKLQDDYVWRGTVPRERRRLVPNEQNTAIVKDTFFSYNGRAAAYADQAVHFSYDRTIQPYEGSPYVMNRFDCARARMGIITTDGGSISSVDTRYGTYTIFSRLRGDDYWKNQLTAHNYEFVSSSFSDVIMEPGYRRVGHWITVRNTGYKVWYADGAVPGGERPTRLALKNYVGTQFVDWSDPGWLGTNNQIKMTPDLVAPGENATFVFNFYGPEAVVGQALNFIPVVDGVGFMRDIQMQMQLRNRMGAYTHVSTSGIPSALYPNQRATGIIRLRNDSFTTWYADGAVPAEKRPIRLALKGYQSSPWADLSDTNWLGTRNQIKMTPATVGPGETATFTFALYGPLSAQAGRLHFLPVRDGTGFFTDISMFYPVGTPEPRTGYEFISATNPPKEMTAGSTASVTLTIKNKGTVVWSPTGLPNLRLMMSRPPYRTSGFFDAGSWLTPSQIAYVGSQQGLDGQATFSFVWRAPSAPGTYTEYFVPVLDGYKVLEDRGMAFTVKVNP